MTAEKLFTEWLNKQEYWLKALYKQLSEQHTLTDDALKDIIDSYVRKNFADIDFSIKEEHSHSITLSKIYDVHGVNRLIANQEISFGENLTVVYGENGTGKTGYSRIIQQIGKYIGDIKPIKPNVFENHIQPQAKIDYIFSDGTPQTLNWIEGKKEQLNIKLFNSECVHFSLNSERKIDFKPHVFYMCEQLATATSKLNSCVAQRLKEFSSAAIDPIIDGTQMRKQIEKVIIDCTQESLAVLDKQIETLHIEELQKQKIELETYRENLSVAALTAEHKRLVSLNKMVSQLSSIVMQSDFYTKKLYNTFMENQKKIQDLQRKSDVDSIIAQLHLQEKIKAPFVKFITEADKLYKLSKQTGKGIEDMDTCLLCGQVIPNEDASIKELLQLYKNLIIASQADSIKKLSDANKNIADISTNITHSLQTLLKTPDINSDKVLSVTIANIVSLLADITNPKLETGLNQQLSILQDYSISIADLIKKTIESINANDEQRKTVNIKLNEVNAKIDVLNNWAQERAYLLSFINLSVLKNINNHGISKCQKDIQEKIYKDSFVAILQSTLNELNAPSEVKFNTAISSSKMAIKQGYDAVTKENQLNEILSEGEQTVVALAQFIAESKFNPDERVLFFDDPVNSLDLKRMRVIAKSLVKLAKEKQIVIFTHNLVFLGYLKTFVEQDKELKKYKFYQTEKTEFNGKIYVGKITERANPNLESYKYYSREIEKLLKKHESNPLVLSEIELAYDYMRSGIELLISNQMLHGTTERYKHDISVMRFGKIDFDKVKEDQEPLTELYEQICAYIPGHSSSLAAKLEPDVDTLMTDYETLKAIANKYKQ